MYGNLLNVLRTYINTFEIEENLKCLLLSLKIYMNTINK